MLEKTNEEIMEIKNRLRKYNKLKSLRDSINDQLIEQTAKREQLLKMHNKELKDVENLEKTSVKSLFLSITGKREEVLQKEKEEHLRAKARFEECQTEIQELRIGLKESENLLLQLGDIENEYSRLLKEKERLLLNSGEEQGKILGEKLIKAGEIEVDIKEVQEAIAAGEASLNSLEGVREKLDSAKTWGTWDLLGGGLIANIGKHSAIDEANNRAREVQHQLRLFKKELSDVNEFTEIEVNISAFASFADFFFDGLIADWFVQSKINDSISHVSDARTNIQSIIKDLQRQNKDLQSDLKSIQEEIKEILHN